MRTALVTALLLAFLAIAPGRSFAQDAGELPLRPGEIWPSPRQRGLDEVHELPTFDLECPVCHFTIKAPRVDALMRKVHARNGNGEIPKWRMHAAKRDTDLCPYPAPGKVAFQADVAVCPSCGYANAVDHFHDELPDVGAAWVLANLRPSLRSAQKRLLGPRGETMSEEATIEFFNHQNDIPDSLRLEHWRTYLAAVHAPALDRARAAILGAWAARRETSGAPKGDFLARHVTQVNAELAKQKRRIPGLHGEIDTLRAWLRRARLSREGLPDANDMAARLILAGLWDRLGFLDEAEKTLQSLYHDFRERFLHADQDPLWSATSQRASRTHRLEELENLRSDAEAEVFLRMELVRRERELLLAAVACLRECIQSGDFNDNPDEALFNSYLIGDFLRRAGNLPLASEWFKNLISLAPEGSVLARAAAMQLVYVGEEAGDKVNLLSALGQDGELFQLLRQICAGTHTGENSP